MALELVRELSYGFLDFWIRLMPDLLSEEYIFATKAVQTFECLIDLLPTFIELRQ